jgi:hypothetical protein
MTVFFLPWLRFFLAFSSVVRQMPGYTSQRRGTVRTLPNQWIVLFYVLFSSIVLFHVLFACKCVLYYCHRVATQLQLNISYQNLYQSKYNYIKKTEFVSERATCFDVGCHSEAHYVSKKKHVCLSVGLRMTGLHVDRRVFGKCWSVHQCMAYVKA